MSTFRLHREPSQLAKDLVNEKCVSRTLYNEFIEDISDPELKVDVKIKYPIYLEYAKVIEEEDFNISSTSIDLLVRMARGTFSNKKIKYDNEKVSINIAGNRSRTQQVAYIGEKLPKYKVEQLIAFMQGMGYMSKNKEHTETVAKSTGNKRVIRKPLVMDFIKSKAGRENISNIYNSLYGRDVDVDLVIDRLSISISSLGDKIKKYIKIEDGNLTEIDLERLIELIEN